MYSPVSGLLIFLCLVLGLTVSLVWGQTPTGFAIGTTTVVAGSTIPITNVGAGGPGLSGRGLGFTPLFCFTASPSTAVWLFPNGGQVPPLTQGGFTAPPNTIQSREQGSLISLHRGDGYIIPAGQYCCGPATNVNERLCVTLASCPLLVLANGMVTYTDPPINGVHNSFTATHTCSNGYLLVGDSIRICDISGSTGTWRGADRTCNAICNDLTPLNNGVITYNPNTSPRLQGTTATHICNTGYELSGGTVRTCQSDRSWSGGSITCQFVDCSTPPTIEGGSRTFTTTAYQSIAEYTCNSGYVLPGSPVVTCLSSGSWSTRPTCIATCTELPTLSNGVIVYSLTTSPRPQGTTAIYSCNTGYELSGGMFRTCQSDRTWSGAIITCQPLPDDRCPVGTYKESLSTGESACVPCPVNSINTIEDTMECTCFDGYFRTAFEGSNFPCTSVPSACRHLQVVAKRTRATTITVRWDRPEIIGREGLYYNIFYSEDNQTFIQHNPRPYIKQDVVIDYSLSGLKPLTLYFIRVTAENGVSDQGVGSSCEVTGATGDIRANAPSLVLGLCSGIVWTTPTRTYGTVTGYDLNFVLSDKNVTVNKGNIELFHLIDTESIDRLNTVVQVRARTSGGVVGRWSELTSLGCTEEQTGNNTCTCGTGPVGS